MNENENEKNKNQEIGNERMNENWDPFNNIWARPHEANDSVLGGTGAGGTGGTGANMEITADEQENDARDISNNTRRPDETLLADRPIIPGPSPDSNPNDVNSLTSDIKTL